MLGALAKRLGRVGRVYAGGVVLEDDGWLQVVVVLLLLRMQQC